MFFELPIEIQVKIVRDYIPVKDKFSLLKIKPFYNLLMQHYCWIKPLKIPLKSLQFHNSHLLDKVKSGHFIGFRRNAIFQVSVDYFTGTVTLLEFKSKKLVVREYNRKVVKYPPYRINSCINRFYQHTQEVDLNDTYETWNRYIITFHPTTHVLYFNKLKNYQMIPCCYNTFRTNDGKVFLFKDRNTLIIFFVIQSCVHRDMCAHLYCARSLGNEEFKYKYPITGSLVRMVKAYSFKNNFRCVSSLKMNFKPKQHNIKLKFVQRYQNLNFSSNETADIFCLN